MEFRCGSLLFTSKFDSGNLARVEKVSKDDDDDSGPGAVAYGDIRPDYEYNVWTKPDCAGTVYENGNRSWFNFGVKGAVPGKLLRINIMNLNRQGKLYSQGHSPLVKTVPGKGRWERIRDKPSYETIDGNFFLSFNHRIAEPKGGTTYFAFCYPWSYAEQQERLNHLDKKFEYCKHIPKESLSDTIYYHRELLCNSLDNLRVDLITISDLAGMESEVEPRFDDKLFPDKDTSRCKKYTGKRVYLVSSRVHPGETPASFVFNGFLDFILREDDPRAKALRRNFVIKLIPILNPDGVARGHYRTDSRGVNLNRMYLDPDFELYPSIYASKSVLAYYHLHYKVEKKAVNNGDDQQLQQNVQISSSSSQNGAIVKSNSSGSVNSRATSQRLMNRPQPPVNRNKNISIVYGRDQPRNDPGIPETSSNNNSNNNGKSGSKQASKQSYSFTKGSRLKDTSLSSTSKENDIGEINSDLACMGLGRESSLRDSLQLSARSIQEVKSYEEVRSSEELMMSGGEYHDQDDDDVLSEGHIGNEGSDDEDDFTPSNLDGAPKAPHLNDPKLLQIKPEESGIAFYVDLHGHASKRGCFIYGNYFENEDVQVTNMLFPKLIAMNTAHFDFTGCNFTERNMYMKDKKDGLSKEGAGRVAIYKAIGIIHSYTLECNYNTGRMVNTVPPAYGDNGRATPPPLAGFPPKYTEKHFEEVGKAMAIAGLDMIEANPWSRLVLSEYASVHGVKDWVRRYIRGLRGLPRGVANRPQRAALRANNSQSTNAAVPGTPGFIPRVGHLAPRQSSISNTSSGSADSVFRSPYRRQSGAMAASQQKKELGPVKDAPRASLSRTRRIASTSSVPAHNMSGGSGMNVNNGSTGATLQHSVSSPVALSFTNATDLKTGSRQNSADQRKHNLRQYLGSNPSINETPPTPPVKASRASSIANNNNHPTQSSHQPEPLFTQSTRHPGNNLNSNSKPTPPPSSSLLRSGYHSDSVLIGLQRQTSSDSYTQLEMEEEKVQQLRNLKNPNISKPQSKGAKSLDPPRAELAKKKRQKGGSIKRRSQSYSPNSGKGPRKLGAVTANSGGGTTDSDNDKKTRSRRKKSFGKGKRKTCQPKFAFEVEDDTDGGLKALSKTEPLGPESLVGAAVRLTPRTGSTQGNSPTPNPTNRDWRRFSLQEQKSSMGEYIDQGADSHPQKYMFREEQTFLLESVPEMARPPVPLKSDGKKKKPAFWIDF